MELATGLGVAAKLAAKVAARNVRAIDVRDALIWCLEVRLQDFILRGMRYSDPEGTAEDVRRRVEDRGRIFFARLVTTFEQPSLPDLRRAQARMNRFLGTVRGSQRLLAGPVHSFLIERLFAAALLNDPVSAVDYLSRPAPTRQAALLAVEVSFDPPVEKKPAAPPPGAWLGEEPEYGMLALDAPLAS